MRPIVLLALGAVALSTAFYLPGLAPVNFCEKAKEKASCPVSFFFHLFPLGSLTLIVST